MKLLYLSEHGVLEYDELRLFSSMGIEWVCLSLRTRDSGPRALMRPEISDSTCAVEMQKRFGTSHPSAPPAALVDWADAIVIMGEPGWTDSLLGRKPVVWRSIGQSNPGTEIALRSLRRRGVYIVRCSPTESEIPGYVGADAVVRFSKRPGDYAPWLGDSAEAVAIARMPLRRKEHLRLDVIMEVLKAQQKAVLIGAESEALAPIGCGNLAYAEMCSKLQRGRAYVTAGIYPGPYTLGFIEAMLSGIPVVAAGSKLWCAGWPDAMKGVYEIPAILDQTGFVSDDVRALTTKTRAFLADRDMASAVGALGRARAISLFGEDVVRDQWLLFWRQLGLTPSARTTVNSGSGMMNAPPAAK